MFIFWTRGQVRRPIRRGYLSCPSCLCRKPGEMFVWVTAVRLFGILPLPFGGQGESFTQLACDGCGNTFAEEGDWAFDFGDHAEPKQWDCRRCGAMNPSDRFHCSGCGRHI